MRIRELGPRIGDFTRRTYKIREMDTFTMVTDACMVPET